MKVVRSFLITCLILAIGTFIVFQGLNLVMNKDKIQENKQSANPKQTIHFLAIGDSLTKGVGDSTQNGGYVPLVANQLKETRGIDNVTTKNYGITGERSDQILKRVQQQEDLQVDIKRADIIVLSAGGNDLVQTFKKEKLKINQESFLQPEKKYKNNLSMILKKLNKQNPKAQIYVFGLYNPYDSLFPEMTEMKDILLSWNTATKLIAEENKATYFSLSSLFNGAERPTISKINKSSEKIDTSSLLYEEDLFHPNDKGYQLIANELYRAIIDHKKISD
ncbi:GDSL-type esterase/lipase family protein [Carnobacterium funditum]|uniref:GDSL-type esterase/lipase family protein n=1 Tax=Carnobacterium funditum TaxID=2752 RepID=UPI00055651DC|nr:GDSL-type esterase/lipase family protein [Carnobacterium funditum]